MSNPSETDAPTVFEGDRGKAARHLLTGLVFVAIGVFALGTGGPAVAGAICIAFFGPVAALQAARALRPPRLTLTRDGLSWQGLRRWRLPWAEVRSIRLSSTGKQAVVLIGRGGGDGRGRAGPLCIPNALLASPNQVLAGLTTRWEAAQASGLAPRVEAPAPPRAAGPPEPRRAVPWASLGLAAGLAAAFALEVWLPAAPGSGPLDPSIATLVAFGGSSRNLTVGEAQWYRVLLAPLLHANLSHIVGNALALLWAGWTLEGLVGRSWFLLIFAVGGLGGEAASLLVNDPGTVDVGASGAVMALFAATLALSWRYRGSDLQGRLQARATGMLAPALFPIARGAAAGGLSINVAAHAGGAAAGVLIGVLLLRGWDRHSERPPARSWAGAAAGLALAASLAAAWAEAGQYRAVVAFAAAQERYKAGDLAAAERAIDIAAPRLPRDAAVQALAGAIAFSRGDPRAAEAALDAAYLADPRPHLLALRGLARFYAGDGVRAQVDLARASETRGDDLYPTIWLAIVRGREGGDPGLGPADLARAPSGWPRPVADVFAGAMTPAALRALAARLGPGDVCEADLYLAERDRIRGEGDAARLGFERASRECPPDFDESGMAHMELGGAAPP